MKHLLMRFPGGRTHAVTLSYDDSITCDLKLADLMRRYGVRGTFNIITGRLAKEERECPPGKWASLTLNQCLQVMGDDMELAMHSRTHPMLGKMPPAEVMREVLADKETLEQLTGQVIRGLAYPYSSYNDETVDVLRACGVSYARTVRDTKRFDVPTDWLRMPTTCHHKDPQLMELAASFLKPVGRYGDCKLFYLWGHSYEFEKDNNWHIMEEFLPFIGGHDHVWYATNIQIHDYVEAYRSLQWSVGRTLVYNPSALDVWACWHDLDHPERSIHFHIPAGKTVRVPAGE